MCAYITIIPSTVLRVFHADPSKQAVLIGEPWHWFCSLSFSCPAVSRALEPRQRPTKPQLPLGAGEQADGSSPPIRSSQSSEGSDGTTAQFTSPPYSAPAAQGTDGISRESETGERCFTDHCCQAVCAFKSFPSPNLFLIFFGLSVDYRFRSNELHYILINNQTDHLNLSIGWEKPQKENQPCLFSW